MSAVLSSTVSSSEHSPVALVLDHLARRTFGVALDCEAIDASIADAIESVVVRVLAVFALVASAARFCRDVVYTVGLIYAELAEVLLGGLVAGIDGAPERMGGLLSRLANWLRSRSLACLEAIGRRIDDLPALLVAAYLWFVLATCWLAWRTIRLSFALAVASLWVSARLAYRTPGRVVRVYRTTRQTWHAFTLSV